MNTCRTCQHWQTHRPGRDGQPAPTPMLAHGFAPCARSYVWQYFPAKTAACGKYQRLPENGISKREQWIKETKETKNANSNRRK